MHIESESSFDVVVVGGGIAGCCAAIEAARAGASVCLVSASGVFSGSSFYPGTWGLGLIGPRDAADIDDMVETILHVGRGAANAALVDSFVRGIPEAIAALEAMGVSLKRPANPDEPQYIPCFDHSLRMWRGLERDSMERGFGRALCEGGVVRFDGCELLDITMDGGCVRGALFFDRSAKRFRAVSCGAIVLAGGGVAGLYKRSLSASGNSATVQAIAARCGARLMNLEFMQIMPGLVAPRRNIVFNEKAFRFARAWDASGEPIARDVLEARSEHGPFSCERAGAPLDFAMEACGDEGMEIACDVGDGSPEFVRTFSGWLERECGVSASAPARIAPYAHASNGGIAIDEHGSCGVPGLFAAGECTGGMHGADRRPRERECIGFWPPRGRCRGEIREGVCGRVRGRGRECAQRNPRFRKRGHTGFGLRARCGKLQRFRCGRNRDQKRFPQRPLRRRLSFPIALWVGFV